MPRSERPAAGRGLRAVAYVLMAVLAVVAVLVLVGESLGDPEGPGVLGVVGWALAPITLAVVAARRPDVARRLLTAGALVVTGLWVWFALAPAFWIDLMDDWGPVLPLLVLAVVLPTAVLARREPTFAGLVLVALGLLPVLAFGLMQLVEAPERAPGVLLGGAVASGAPPALLAGLLFLISARLDRRSGVAATRGPST
jgi:hypothetical protein